MNPAERKLVLKILERDVNGIKIKRFFDKLLEDGRNRQQLATELLGLIIEYDKYIENINPSIIEYLLDDGANPNALSTSDGTPLVSAAMISNYPEMEQVVKLLLKYGAEPMLKGKKGLNALETADAFRNPSYVNLMIQHQLQKARRHKQQMQVTKQGKRMLMTDIKSIPRTQILEGGRYIYPGGLDYIQAGMRSGMDLTGLDQGYPQGYQQFWRQYKPQPKNQGGAGPSRYSVRSPRRKSIKKKSVRRY
jgi:hypothetical protein